MESFEIARQDFLSKLNDQEKALMEQATSPEAVLSEVKALEEKHRDQSTTRKLVEKINPFIRGIEQYQKAFDVLINAKPEILSLIWGSARIVIHLVREFSDLFEKLVEMFCRLGKQLGRFKAYNRLYPNSGRLKEGLTDAYGVFLEFCLKTKVMLTKGKSKKSLWISSSSVKLGLKSIWKPIKLNFGETTDKLDTLVDEVDKEADLAEKEEASNARDKAEKRAQYQEHKSLFDWLDPVDSSTNYNKAVSLHEDGTGEWIFENEHFKEWLCTDGSAIWLHAKPGAGKTIMSSTVITYLKGKFQDTDTVVAYYYCDYKNPATQAARKVFESLLAEMARQSPAILKLMESFSEKYREYKASCSLEILGQKVLECLDLLQNTFIVIDALDECIDRADLLRELLCIVHKIPRLRLFLTSREEFDIKQSLSHLPQLSLSASDVSPDISKYVERQLNELVRSKKLKLRDEKLHEEIRDALSSKADGMFQWVKCQLDALCQKISDKGIREALANVPIGLDETYIRVFERIRTQFAGELPVVRRIFFWLVHSLRPLKAAELADALGYVADEDCFDFTAVPTDPEDLLRYCGGLVSLSDAKGTIGLAHFSIKEFLLSERIRNSSVKEFYADHDIVHAEIVTICISYLSMDDFATGQCYTRRQLLSRVDSHSLMKYAAFYWTQHYKRVIPTLTGEMDLRVFKFLTESKTASNVLAWQQVVRKGEYYFDQQNFGFEDQLRGPNVQLRGTDIDILSPVYLGAHYGLWGVTQLLLDAGYDVNAAGGEFEYPILAAAFGKFRDWAYVSKLIDAGADIHVTFNGGNIAYANAKFGTPEDWRLLKDLVLAGANFNDHVGDYSATFRTVLEAIAYHPSDSSDMVKFLLERGADANEMNLFPEQEPGTHRTKMLYRPLEAGPPLQQAARQGNLKVAQILLDHGARIEFAHCQYGSPLQAATEGGHAMMVQFLLEKGANVNTKGGILGSPLQAAAYTGNNALVELYLGINADVNADGGAYGSPLAAAIANKQFEIANILLQKQANPNGGRAQAYPYWERMITDAWRFTRPVLGAIHHCELPVLNRLIDAGADLCLPNSRCTYDWLHPLCVAIEAANHAVLDLILSRGPPITNGRCCALVTAARENNFALFKRLYGEIRRPYDAKYAFLDAFSCNSDEEFTRNLIELMRSLSIRFTADVCGSLLSHSQSPAKVEFLLKNGANPNKVVIGGHTISRGITIYGHSTPLVMAIEGNGSQVAHLLLDHGADVNLVHPIHPNGSPLFAAMRRGNVGLFRRLLELGTETNKYILGAGNHYNSYCWNMLHHAAALGNLEMVILLLEHGADLHAHCDTCPTALWRAVQAEDCEMIQLLVQKGAEINDLDIYGRKILRRAQENHLDIACKLLSKLGAQSDPLPEEDAQERIETTVKRFSKELSKRLATRDWPGKAYFQRWAMLARCFYLANDIGNAAIAIEQPLQDRFGNATITIEQVLQDQFAPISTCSICGKTQHKHGKYHLCKDGDKIEICEDCIGKHERQLKAAGTLDTHEFLTYPRPFISAIPKDFVALSETEFILREDWLENIQTNWSFESVEAGTLGAHQFRTFTPAEAEVISREDWLENFSGWVFQ